MNYELDNETVQRLIDELHMHEVDTIDQFRYRNPQARSNDFHDCSQAYQTAHDLLEMETNQSMQQEKSSTQDLWNAARAGIRFSYETIRNWKLRGEYLNRIKKIITDNEYNYQINNFLIDEDDDTNYTQLREKLYQALNKEVNNYAESTSKIWGLAARSQQLSAKDFVKGAKIIPNFNITQYIVEHAGESQMRVLSYMRFFGTTMIVFTLGMIAWEIMDSKTKINTSSEMLVSLGGALGGGTLGEAGASLLLFGWVVADEAAQAVVGVLGGLIGSFAGGMAAASLFGALMNAFIYTPEDHKWREELFNRPILYELKLPDNMSLSSSLVVSLTNS